MGYRDASNIASLATVSMSNGTYSMTKLTDIVPQSLSAAYLDYRGGKIAMYVAGDVRPTINDDKYAIAWLDIKNPADVRYAPRPAKVPGKETWIWNAIGWCPKILPDGKVVYAVQLTDPTSEVHYSQSQFAIWDPVTNTVTPSGWLMPFVNNQQDKGTDPDDANLLNHFAVSPDGKYVYGVAYGYGYDAGAYHQDNCYLMKYLVGSAGGYERIYAATSSAYYPYAVRYASPDGNWLVFGQGNGQNPYGKLTKLNTVTLAAEVIDGYWSDNISCTKTGAAHVKYWTDVDGGGINYYDLNANKAFRVIQGNKLNDTLTRGYRTLGGAAAINSDGSKIYFTAERGSYVISGGTEIMIEMTGPIEMNTKVDTLCVLPKNFNKYDGMIMILVD